MEASLKEGYIAVMETKPKHPFRFLSKFFLQKAISEETETKETFTDTTIGGRDGDWDPDKFVFVGGRSKDIKELEVHLSNIFPREPLQLSLDDLKWEEQIDERLLCYFSLADSNPQEKRMKIEAIQRSNCEVRLISEKQDSRRFRRIMHVRVVGYFMCLAPECCKNFFQSFHAWLPRHTGGAVSTLGSLPMECHKCKVPAKMFYALEFEPLQDMQKAQRKFHENVIELAKSYPLWKAILEEKKKARKQARKNRGGKHGKRSSHGFCEHRGDLCAMCKSGAKCVHGDDPR